MWGDYNTHITYGLFLIYMCALLLAPREKKARVQQPSAVEISPDDFLDDFEITPPPSPTLADVARAKSQQVSREQPLHQGTQTLSSQRLNSAASQFTTG